MTSPRIGVVLTTHNSRAWIVQTLDSIANQTLRPSRVVVVDDESVDDTYQLVRDWVLTEQGEAFELDCVRATSNSLESWTRIAANFVQGVRCLQAMDYIALGDHDDVWLTNRLEVQSQLMRDSNAMFLSNDGLIQDSDGTLFQVFDVPPDIQRWDSSRILRHILRHSVATGSASMIRPSTLMTSRHFVPPPGWLHDRWWSILSAAHGMLQVSREPVISYRISVGQSVGLNRGRQQSGALERLRSADVSDVNKLTQLHSLQEEAAPELRKEFSWGRLLRSLI